MHRIVRRFFLLAGLLSVGLGIAGVFLPLLPTTPFLLLAVFCFSRSSRRLNAWLLGHRFFGTYLRNYREGPCMTRRHKGLTLLLLWTGIGLSAALGVHLLWARLLLAAVGVGVTTHLLWIPAAPAARRTTQR